MELDPRLQKSDFDILQVDFDWVAKTENLRTLKKAYEAIRREGGYDNLEKALSDKINSLDKSG